LKIKKETRTNTTMTRKKDRGRADRGRAGLQGQKWLNTRLSEDVKVIPPYIYVYTIKLATILGLQPDLSGH
jgi:hypothetical protein